MKNAVLQVREGKPIRKAAKEFGFNDTTLGYYCKKWTTLSDDVLKNNNMNEKYVSLSLTFWNIT